MKSQLQGRCTRFLAWVCTAIHIDYGRRPGRSPPYTCQDLDLSIQRRACMKLRTSLPINRTFDSAEPVDGWLTIDSLEGSTFLLSSIFSALNRIYSAVLHGTRYSGFHLQLVATTTLLSGPPRNLSNAYPGICDFIP